MRFGSLGATATPAMDRFCWMVPFDGVHESPRSPLVYTRETTGPFSFFTVIATRLVASASIGARAHTCSPWKASIGRQSQPSSETINPPKFAATSKRPPRARTVGKYAAMVACPPNICEQYNRNPELPRLPSNSPQNCECTTMCDGLPGSNRMPYPRGTPPSARTGAVQEESDASTVIATRVRTAQPLFAALRRRTAPSPAAADATSHVVVLPPAARGASTEHLIDFKPT